MTLTEAYDILEVDRFASEQDIKENFRWLVKFYHPDHSDTPDVCEFKKVILAFNTIKEHR